MKKINKVNFLTACLIMLFMSACTEEIVREPSPVANSNSSNVYFSVVNDATPILGITQTSFDVIVIREKSDKEQTVELNIENVYDTVFSVPTSITFAAGEDSINVNIPVKNMELMKKYHLSISIDQEQTNPYVDQKVYPRLELVVLKEDFAPFAEGTYASEFFEDSWATILEYSPSTNIYRFKDCWMPGYDVTFKWDGVNKGSEVTIIGKTTSAKDFTYLPTGYIHSKYGMVSAYYGITDKNYFNKETSVFTFPITWRVSAGSFGMYNDTFTITSEL